jgi:hypothetical protein
MQLAARLKAGLLASIGHSSGIHAPQGVTLSMTSCTLRYHVHRSVAVFRGAFRNAAPDTATAEVLRREHGRAVAVLVRRLGDISLAEAAVGQSNGPPPASRPRLTAGFHAVRADLLLRLNRQDEAASAYGAALECCGNSRERGLLERQLLAESGALSLSQRA